GVSLLYRQHYLWPTASFSCDAGRGKAGSWSRACGFSPLSGFWPSCIWRDVTPSRWVAAVSVRRRSGLTCGMTSKHLLIVAHAPSENTRRLRDALAEGASAPEIEAVDLRVQSPFDADAADVLAADALLLFTTENLGYM